MLVIKMRKSLLAFFICLWISPIIASPISLNPLDIFHLLVICPNGEIVFGSENNCAEVTEEITTTDSTLCKMGQVLLEDYNICIDFDLSQEYLPDINEHCGVSEQPTISGDSEIYESYEVEHEIEKVWKFFLVRTSQEKSAVPTVRCYCKFYNDFGQKILVYDPQTQNCVSAYTQEACDEGEWLILVDVSQYKCVKNDCPITGDNVVLYNEKCVRLFDFCDDGHTKRYSIHEETGRVDCMTQFSYTTLFGKKSHRIPPTIIRPGTKRTSERRKSIRL